MISANTTIKGNITLGLCFRTQFNQICIDLLTWPHYREIARAWTARDIS